MSIPVGFGLPGWLDTDVYLSSLETRGLGRIIVSKGHQSEHWKAGQCGLCGQWHALQKAHVVRVGSSGARRRGTDGPQYRICVACHTELDQHSDRTLAVRRSDLALCLVWENGDAEVLVTDCFGEGESR